MNQRQLYGLLKGVGEAAGVSADGEGFAGRVLETVVSAARAVRGMPCRDGDAVRKAEGMGELLRSPDVLGRVYQALNAPALERAYRGTARERRKFGEEEIACVTQLFTPGWVAAFLVENTLGRLWGDWHPNSAVAEGSTWLIRREEVTAGEARRAIDVRVIDPACGTMNFGLAACDLLERMYREEMDRAGRAGWPAEPSVRTEGEIGRAILRHNLVGIDIDPVALALAGQTLAMRLRCDDVAPRLVCADALGGGVGGEGAFDVVVTNPPYLSARNMPHEMSRRLKGAYPAAWRDLYACFLMRCVELARGGGRVGVLAMQSFMFTGAFEGLRRELAGCAGVEAVAHFGPGLFEVGNAGTLQTAAVVMRKGEGGGKATFVRLTDEADEQRKRDVMRGAIAARRNGETHPNVFDVDHAALAWQPRGAWAYWVSEEVARVFAACRKLRDVAPPKQGLATTDNGRFVRYWWEVAAPTDAAARATKGKWVPYAKGGGFRRWWGPPRHVVNWRDDGAEIKAAIVARYPYLKGKWQWVAKNARYYGRAGVTWSYLTSGTFSARLLPVGCIFDVAASSVFHEDDDVRLALLGVLNSSAAGQLLEVINPTINFQVGDLAELPVPELKGGWVEELRGRVASAVAIEREIDSFDETGAGFRSLPDWDGGLERIGRLRVALDEEERRIDRLVGDAYGVEPCKHRSVARSDEWDVEELACRWVNRAMGEVLVRREEVGIGEAAGEVREYLVRGQGARAADEMDRALGRIERFLAAQFGRWHENVYRKRPIYWTVGRGKDVRFVPHWSFPGNLDDGIAARWERFRAARLPKPSPARTTGCV